MTPSINTVLSFLTQGVGPVFQVCILDRESQEVQDALVLGAGAYMLRHLVPIIPVHLKGFQEQEGLLVRPLFGHASRGRLALDSQTNWRQVWVCRILFL